VIGVCTKCGKAFETTTEDAYTPGVLCVECYRAEHNAPGVSPIYAAARDMLAAILNERPSVTRQMGALFATLHHNGNSVDLWLMDADPLHADTLATWAVAFGQPADAEWFIDYGTGERVAHLEWAVAGEARPDV